MKILETGALVRCIETGELLRVAWPSDDGLSVLCDRMPHGAGRQDTLVTAPDRLLPA